MPPSASLVALSATAATLIGGTGYYVWTRMRRLKDPEKHRRLRVDGEGRIIEGTITDVRDGFIYYSWSWRGVIYEASQDVNSLAHLMPPDPNLLVGQTSIKFLPRDPHNSIVMSENWRGFRLRKRVQDFSGADTPI